MFFKDTKLDREAVFEQLKVDEGVVYEVYKDHLGYPTFGVGHLVLDSDPEFGLEVGSPITEERVKECFEHDLDCVGAVEAESRAQEDFLDERMGNVPLLKVPTFKLDQNKAPRRTHVEQKHQNILKQEDYLIIEHW